MAFNPGNMSGYNITGSNQMYRPPDLRGQVPAGQPPAQAQQVYPPRKPALEGLQADRREGSSSPIRAAAVEAPIVKRHELKSHLLFPLICMSKRHPRKAN